MYESANQGIFKCIGMECVNSMSGRLYQYLKKLLEIFHVELSENNWAGLLQFIKFGIVGISNTVISYVLNVLVLLVLRPWKVSWDFIAGNVVAFILSVLWSFYWNNRFVFVKQVGEQEKIWKVAVKTYIAYGLTGILLSNILSWIWINVFGISKYVVPLINIVICVPLNFVINKFWTFKADNK